MHKFRVGDIIIGNKKNTRYFSGVGSICRVTRVFEFSVEGYDMKIDVIKGNLPLKNLIASSHMFNLYKSNFRRGT